MKKTVLIVFILLLSISLFGCTNKINDAQLKKEGQHQEEQQLTDGSDKTAIASLVEDFGGKLQTVSLQAPPNIVSKSIQENYGDFISPTLLAEWLSKPENAPGRVLSSPWPDRIEILNIMKLSEQTYKVIGNIIDITSVEKVNGGTAAKQPITLVVEKIENRWVINAVTLGTYEQTNSIVYKNTQYGFNFSLPVSWNGYSIVTNKWEGLAIGNGETVETGPMISIRHPQWTSENRRQDIPIMIFSLNQWDSLQQEKFHIGAAPIGPKELGRNTRYVFALPARYNFAFPPGYEEVEKILESNPLQANE
ncbi:hypothetical protein Dtox_2575 [Desulfofarcimen acetoxidans DSM 771]|jgi:hypothetical protein|uniref:Lipoprotein n=1 Tax=Desulfofarcimen acetoxidans (strain ATCC 49208 / DSM 771 / KCTC 5769 / VKM B-1644 / 5575) TaxID=485916 RepID=C8W0X2_DESAS|nr:hypothetical protein [Desulfofarcimen acetoxidans]ACV63368.1 hypothetical protein Dtox_2575 [Desulfofarcimen acetoxidans DSM 771]